MKKQVSYILMALIFSTLIIISNALATSCCDTHEGDKMDHVSDVDGYQLEYKFINMKEKMKDMPEMAQHLAATHHLMVFIKTPKGETVTPEKVGFLIDGPDGKDQKVMAMCMSGGYGADIELTNPGQYTVKTKAILGDRKLMDSFTYLVK